MANTESPFHCERAKERDDNGCKSVDNETISINPAENDESCAKIDGDDQNFISKSHDTPPGEIFPDSEVETAGTTKDGVHDLPVVQVNLSESESKSLPQHKSRELHLEETSLLESVEDLERNCSSVRNSLPEPFMMSVSPTASIFNYLSSVPSPLDKSHEDGLLIEQAMSPSSPTVDSIIHVNNQNSLQNNARQLDNGRTKTTLDNFKSIDAYISSSCLPDLSDFSPAKSSRNITGKGKTALAKPTPYPLTNPTKQKGDKMQETNCPSNKSSCCNTIYNEQIQNIYATSVESRPSCRFVKPKNQSLSESVDCSIPVRPCQSEAPNDIPEIARSPDTLSFLEKGNTSCKENGDSNENKEGAASKRDVLSGFGKIQQRETQTAVSLPQSPGSLCSTFFTKNTFMAPTTSSSSVDKSAPSLVNITGHSTFSNNTMPMLCRDDFSCDKNVNGISKLSAPYASKGEEYNDKDGLSQYLCGDESTLKGDLPCSLYYSGNSNTAILNSNATSRRHSSVSSVTSSSSKRSNTNVNFADHHIITLPITRRESSHSDVSTDFQTAHSCSEVAQEKRLASPTMCEFGLEAPNLTGQGYLSCSLGPTGVDAGDTTGTILDSSSPLEISASAPSCLYSTNFNNVRNRKEEVTVPAGM